MDERRDAYVARRMLRMVKIENDDKEYWLDFLEVIATRALEMDEYRNANVAHQMRHMDKIEILEECWLDCLEVVLEQLTRWTSTEMFARHLAQRPERVMVYIKASTRHRAALTILTCLLRKLRQQQLSMASSNEHEREQCEAARRALTEWALDAHAGILKKPQTRGRDKYALAIRDAVIASTVNGIRNLGARPATSRLPDRSACHAVANRIGLSYDAVRTIWQNNQFLFKK